MSMCLVKNAFSTASGVFSFRTPQMWRLFRHMCVYTKSSHPTTSDFLNLVDVSDRLIFGFDLDFWWWGKGKRRQRRWRGGLVLIEHGGRGVSEEEAGGGWGNGAWGMSVGRGEGIFFSCGPNFPVKEGMIQNLVAKVGLGSQLGTEDAGFEEAARCSNPKQQALKCEGKPSPGNPSANPLEL